jgi:hypothetical protein
MRLVYTDGRPISDVTELRTSVPVGTAPIEYAANVTEEAATLLRTARAPFYRAEDGDQRFTLTIDQVKGVTISGTIRRR